MNRIQSLKSEIKPLPDASNLYTCIVHLQCVAYPYPDTTSKTNLWFGRLSHESASVAANKTFLSVSLLWMLVMAGCEVEGSETRE